MNELEVKNNARRQTPKRSPRSSSSVLPREKDNPYFLFTSPSPSSLSRPLAGSSGTCHTSPLPPGDLPVRNRWYIPGGLSGSGPEVYTIRIAESLRESDKHNYLPLSVFPNLSTRGVVIRRPMLWVIEEKTIRARFRSRLITDKYHSKANGE